MSMSEDSTPEFVDVDVNIARSEISIKEKVENAAYEAIEEVAYDYVGELGDEETQSNLRDDVREAVGEAIQICYRENETGYWSGIYVRPDVRMNTNNGVFEGAVDIAVQKCIDGDFEPFPDNDGCDRDPDTCSNIAGAVNSAIKALCAASYMGDIAYVPNPQFKPKSDFVGKVLINQTGDIAGTQWKYELPREMDRDEVADWFTKNWSTVKKNTSGRKFKLMKEVITQW